MAIAIKYGIIKKSIIVLLVIVITSSFIIRNYIYAVNADDAQEASDEYSNQATTMLDEMKTLFEVEDSINDKKNEGGALFMPVTDFVVGVADNILGTLQSVFLEDRKILSNLFTADSIKLKGPAGLKKVTLYLIKYSPAAIFSGIIPALDVNFFSTKGEEGKVDVKKSSINYETKGTYTYQECKDSFGAPDSVNIYYDKMSTTEILLRVVSLVCVIDAIEAIGNFNVGVGLEVEATVGSLISAATFGVLSAVTWGTASVMGLARQTSYWRLWQDETTDTWYFWISSQNLYIDQLTSLYTDIEKKSGTLYEINEEIVINTKESTAYALRSSIATWYRAIRVFALVSLLSVLVYIGIKIVLSSTSAENKAKYKNMLVDWLTAVCILFILHYLMALILSITERITEIFKVTTISEGGIDYLMTTIRNSIVQVNGSVFQYWGYAIMYIALVILTLTFTYEYIKRLILLALLTMIAPLIALTYPLDKIKDNQAQGFSLWLREYIFNCLIQPLHLLLYIMIVTTAIKSMNNPIIAIVALALFRPAENFLRKLFGFDRATTMNSLKTLAGGAVIMKLLNKIPKSHKNSQNENSGANKPEGKKSVRMNENNTSSTDINFANRNATFSKDSNTTTQSSKNKSKSLANKPLKNAPKALARGLRWTAKTGMKVGGALAGTLVGISAGVADGEIGLPVENVVAGAYAGGKAGETTFEKTDNITKKVVNGIGNKIDNLKEKQDKEKNGEKNYNKSSIRQSFYESDGWKEIADDPSITGDKIARTEEFLNNGIYDPDIIKQSLQNDISATNYIDYSEAGVETVKDMSKLQEVNITPKDYGEFKKCGIADVDKISKIKSKHKSEPSSKVASYMSIAKHGKHILNDQVAFTRLARSFDATITDDEAEKLRKEISSYLI